MNKITLNNTRYYLILLIIPLILIPFLHSSALLDISLLPRFLVLNIWLLIISVFFVFYRKNLSFFANKFLTVYILYVSYSLISLLISNNFSDAAFQFVMITNFGLVILFYFILFYSFSFRNQDIALIFNILAFFVLVLSFNDYYKILSTSGITHQSIYDIKAGFSHKNILSEVLFVLFPFSLYFLFLENKWVKLFGLINSIGILFFIVILLTRAVWLAVIVGFISSFLLFILISGKMKIFALLQNKKTYLFIFTFIFVIISSVFIYSKLDSFETIKKSTKKIFKVYDSSQHRIELWKRSIDITKENPILGNGLGTWRIEVLKYGNRNLQSEDNVTFYQRPHNDFLWILSEQGIIGLLIYLVLLIIIFYYLIHIIKNSLTVDTTVFYYLLLYLFTGYLIFSFFSFPRERIEHNLILGIILSLIIAKYQRLNDIHANRKTSNKYLLQISVYVCFFLLFSTKLAYTRFNSELHLRNAFEARSNNNWNKVIKEIDKSESVFYQLDPFSTPLSWYRGEAWFKSGNTDLAFVDFQKSIEINPYHIHVLNNLATTYEIKGEHQKAIELYKRALQISPKFDDALLNLTAVYFNLGYLDSACNIIYNVDTLSKNVKYPAFLGTLLKKRIDNKLKIIDNKFVVDLMMRIKNNNEWIFNIFRKSKTNCINFDNQLLIDCFFVLRNVDKSINEFEYNELRNKYLKN